MYQWGSCWVSPEAILSPGQTSPGPTVSSHCACTPDPGGLVTSAGLAAVCLSLSCIRNPQTGCYSRCGLTSTEQKGIITSLDLLAVPGMLLMLSPARASCLLVLRLLFPARTPQSFLQSCLPIQLPTFPDCDARSRPTFSLTNTFSFVFSYQH